MIAIAESEMNFGDFDETNIFHIEKSRIYKELGTGIKTVEFILKYKKDYSNVNCLESMAHSLFKEFDRMSDSENEEMNDIFGPNPI